MDTIDNLNFGKDSSTKFKLKLDNSIVKLALPEAIEETDCRTFSANTQQDETRFQKSPNIPKPIKEDLRLQFYEEDYYLNNIVNYNAKLLSMRESVHFDKCFGMTELYDLESTQLKHMQTSIPVIAKSMTGQTFYLSNNKLEPNKISAEEFVKMNIQHQNTMFDADRQGFNSFAPRRRRRGTLKAFKNARQMIN